MVVRALGGKDFEGVIINGNWSGCCVKATIGLGIGEMADYRPSGTSGDCAMADVVLDGRGQLGHRFAVLGQIEDRIVAEAVRTPRHECDVARNGTLGEGDVSVGLGDGDDTAKAGCAAIPRNSSQLEQYLLDSFRIGCVLTGVAS